MTGVIVACVLSLAMCQGALYISTTESHWANASSYCSMATPPITPTPAGYSVDIHDINLSDDEDVWVGYYRDYRVFEYMDCIKLEELLETSNHLQTLDIESGPDQCFPGCGHTSIVGVTHSKCYCIGENYNKTKKSKETNCTAPCLYPPGVACGDRNGLYVSVYRLNKNASTALLQDNDSVDEDDDIYSVDENEANCLTFHLSDRNFMWKNCRQSLDVECFTGHGVIHVKENSSWLDATNTCFQYKQSPTSYENSTSVKNISTGFVWTGLIRSRIIHQNKGNSFGTDKGVLWETRFGFLTKTSSNGYLLRFETDSTKRRILCQTTVPSDTKNPISTFIVIGVIVVVVIVVVVSGSATVYYKKRKMGSCRRKEIKSANPDYSYAGFPLSAGTEDSQQSNDYYILEPREREAATFNDVEHANDCNIICVVDRDACVKNGAGVSNATYGLATQQSEERSSSENEYNRLDIGNGEKRKHTDNVYNRLTTQKFVNNRSDYNVLTIRNGEDMNYTDNVYTRLDTQ